jgi:late competence protein required for DNA uptake (superfamily II DNA/RNA helicase)
MTKHDGGKGDAPRPLSIPKEQFEANWDAIFNKNKLANKLVKQIEENVKNESKTSD